MFQGSIPQDVRNILFQAATTWTTDKVAVACSGNLTVERVLANAGRFAIQGCDVSIYSCALGAFFARKPFRLALRDPLRAEWGWLEQGLQTQAGGVATLMLCSQFSKGIDKAGALKRNAYYERLIAGYQRQWPELLERTVRRLESVPLHLTDFHIGDATPWLESLPSDVAVISYPPFFAKGYAVMWRGLDTLFDWDAPAYEEIFEEQRRRFVAALMNRDHWILGSSQRLDDHADKLRGVAQTTLRGVPIFMYTSGGPTRVVTPRQKVMPVLLPRLSHGQQIGERMALVPLEAPQFQAVRSQYLNEKIKVASSSGYAVTVDGVMIGAFAQQISFENPIADPATCYLLSDFPVSPTDYKRLAKLVLYAALSHEARLLAERLARRRIRTLFTTAFSENPVSMKYRGLFDLHSRMENPNYGADPNASRYLLNYAAPMGQWTLAEGLEEWKRKHGVRVYEHDP